MFSDDLGKQVDAITGPLTYVRNPIDLTFETNTFLFKDLLETVFASGEVDGAVIFGIFGAPDFMVNLNKRFPDLEVMLEGWEEGFQAFLKELAGISMAYGKPLVVMSFFDASSSTTQALIDCDIPVFPSASRSARAMRSLLDYHQVLERA
jgi:hypothetical protein